MGLKWFETKTLLESINKAGYSVLKYETVGFNYGKIDNKTEICCFEIRCKGISGGQKAEPRCQEGADCSGGGGRDRCSGFGNSGGV